MQDTTMRKNLKTRRGIILVLLILMSAIFTFKAVGWLQPFEWMVFDTFIQLRPKEPIDRRIIIVALTEKDIKKLNQYPISDRNLANVLNKIKQQKPRVIGLDIFRDVPVLEGQASLAQVFESTPDLFGIQKVGLDDSIESHPVLKKLGQVSTVDTLVDGDRKLRRTLLYPMIEGSENVPNLGLAVALRYLEKQGLKPSQAPDGSLQLGKAIFHLLEENDGGYSKTDAGSYQVLTNYRGAAGSFTTVSFSDVLANTVFPTLMRDRIVLIGVSAESVKDFFFTPYSKLETTPEQMAGVEVNANIASQVISSTLDNRPLFKFIPEIVEDAGVFLVTIFTLFLIWKSRPSKYKEFSIVFTIKLFIIITLTTSSVIGFSYLAFLNSFWLPVFLPLLCLVTCSFFLAGYVYLDQIKVTNTLLKQKNKDLQIAHHDLKAYNIILKDKTLALQESEARLVLALDSAKIAIWDWELETNEVCILSNCKFLLDSDYDNINIDIDDFFRAYVCEESLEPLMEKLNFIINDRKECEFDFKTLWSTGTSHHLSVKGEVYYDTVTAEATRMIGILSDITKNKEIEIEFTNYEKKQRGLLTNSFDTVMLLKKDLNILYISPSFERVLGYQYSNVVGKKITNFIHSGDISLFNSAIERVIARPATTFRLEYKWMHNDGTWRTIESVICNYFHESAIDALVINSRDITEYVEIKKSLHDIELSVKRLMDGDERSF